MDPSYFTMRINETLKGLDFCFTSIDDVIIYSKTERQHLNDIRQMFDRLQKVNVKLKVIKCDFFRSQIHYLRHLPSKENITPLLRKFDVIKSMPPP